jgi:SET domain-containing protein
MYKIIEIDESELGKRVVASEKIRKNTVVMRFTGVPLTYKETKALGEKESFGLQVSNDCYLYLDPPSRYFNHSCEPNCGVLPNLDLVSLYDIEESEELTFDYSTTMLERDWTMECKCGSPGCRKVIRDFDQLPEDRKKFYLDHNVVQRFIVEQLKEKHGQAAGNRQG